MQISAIVAMSENRVIGKDNKLPWHLPADLQHFKNITMGKSILLGRKTYESIGRSLPGRRNIIITHDQRFQATDCIIVHSIEAALAAASSDEVFVIGGALLFQQMLPYVKRLYITLIHHTFAGDTFFPEWNPDEWQEVERIDHQPDTKNNYAYSFMVFDKLNTL